MFQFPGYAPCDKHKVIEFCSMGFPHSEISGSKVVWHLPETYRSQTTSFVAPFSQGIHHAPLMELPVRSSTNRFVFCVLTLVTTMSSDNERLKLSARPVRLALKHTLLDSFVFSFSARRNSKQKNKMQCVFYTERPVAG